jgi:tetratricopeptide (TPR) repeat protein
MQASHYLCSFHIPKTGGTTFAGHARRLLSPEEFVFHGPFARVDRFLNNQPQIEELPESETGKIKIVHGHGAGVGLAKTIRGRIPEFMVILRDPYARFVSGFHHFNNERTNSGRERIPEEKYFEKRSENFFARLLLKHFGELAPSTGKLSIDSLMPILQSYKYILLTEYLDLQLPEICKRYGLKSNAIEARRINKSKSDLAVDREDFDRRNDIDQTIYSTLAAAASHPGAPIDNPFGYRPDAVTDYLQKAWSSDEGESRLANAYDDLVEACRKTLKLQAAHLKLTSGTANHVADKEMLLDRVNAAMPDWLRGLGDKELSVAHFCSGSMFMKEGNLSAAEHYLQEAVRLNPENDNALAHLAKLLHKRGKKGAAASYLSRAFELRPERPITQALRKFIGI